MTLENTYYIGQTIAVIIIVATLVAVLFQMRQANRLAKLETTRTIWASATEMLRSQVEDDEKAAFLHRSLFSGEKLSDEEKTRLALIMASMFVGFENGFAMSQSGMMEKNFWPRMRDSMADYLRPARGRRWWKLSREKTFAANAAFVAEVDSVVAQINADEARSAA